MTVDGGVVEKLLLFLEELFFYFEQFFLEIAHRDLRRSVQKKIYTYICDSLNDMIYSLLFD